MSRERKAVATRNNIPAVGISCTSRCSQIHSRTAQNLPDRDLDYFLHSEGGEYADIESGEIWGPNVKRQKSVFTRQNMPSNSEVRSSTCAADFCLVSQSALVNTQFSNLLKLPSSVE